MKPSISLAMIVRDSEKTLDRCLSSFSQISDEIIVVDTGSVDNTIDIARKYTNKIYHFKWINDFSAARNFSFSKCTGDFIHWCDSDDYMLSEDIAKLKAYDFSDKEILILPYAYSHDEFGSVNCFVPRERIIKRSLNPVWQKRIHEYLPMNGKITITDIVTHHDKQGGTSERNLEILQAIIAEGDIDSRNFFYLAKELQDSGKNDDALKYFQQFVSMPGAFWEDVFRSYHYMAQIWLQRGDEAKFKENLYKSIDMEERRAEPYCLMGDYYMGKQQWDKAIHWLNIATNVRRPKELLSAYQPEYNTWIPYLNLTVCANNLGDVRRAYDYNEKVLEYRPKDTRALNNKAILKNALKKDQYLKDGAGKKLNLGGKDEALELDNIPYKSGTISAICSDHSLEQLTLDRVRPALLEWFRVLAPGGELMLKIPDLEDCCRQYLSAPINSDNFFKTKCWYKCTIYGIQKSEDQYNCSGFSKEEMAIILKDTGFILDYIKNYDALGIPSLEVRAVKPVSPMKIGWIAPEDWEAAQTRIRVLRVNQWLRAHGYHSTLVNYPEIINQNYDVAIVGKGFSEDHYKNIKMLKQHRKTIYCDVCESLWEFSWYKEILEICDKVICCSHVLAEEVKKINPNVEIIEDAWEG